MMTDIKNIKNYMEIARKAVEGEEEPYKTEAFKIILGRLLDSGEENVPPTQELLKKNSGNKTQDLSFDFEQKKNEFVKNCGITVNELDDVIYIKDNIVQLIASLSGSETQKQVTAAKCILAIYENILDKEWVNSSTLSQCINSSGISTTHLSRNLRKYSSNFLRVSGQGKGKSLEYKITGPGRISAYEDIKKLAKGEKT